MTQLIVALDTPDLSEAESLGEQLKGSVSAFKVGLTLLASYGPDSIDVLRSYGPIFADVKYHDIPEQIRAASEAISRREVWMFTVHASGGPAMVKAAVEGAKSGGTNPLVAGVTVLTSLSAEQLSQVGQGEDLELQTLRLAKQVKSWGATAVVCRGQSVMQVRQVVGEGVPIVVPGVRPSGGAANDQSSIVTPEIAALYGADYIVVGRPITKAPDPARAAREILETMNESART